MRSAESIAKSVAMSKTGLFATLCGRLYASGSGASFSAVVRRYVLAVVVIPCALVGILGGVGAAPASAESLCEQQPGRCAPGWRVFGRFAPTNLKPGGEAVLVLYVYDMGAVASSGTATLVDRLPEGLEVAGGPVGGVGLSGGCTGVTEVTCPVGTGQPGGVNQELTIPVRVAADAGGLPPQVDRVSVSGGGAVGVSNAEVPVVYSAVKEGFGFANFDVWMSNPDGSTDTQAGSHPYEITTVFAPNSEGIGSGGETPTGGEIHALDVNLPPGLVGEPGAVPECPRQQFDNETCPAGSLIGENYASFSGNGQFHSGVYNMVPPPGIAAQFGTSFNGTSVFLDARVRSGGDDGITENIPVLVQRKLVFNTTTIWGVPGEHSFPGESPQELSERGLRPLLTLPTSCGAVPRFSIEALGTWQEANAFAQSSSPYRASDGSEVGITGCERMAHFTPSISIAPDTTAADSPAGLTATVRVPQGLNPEGLATPGLKNTTVVLPEGMAINPGQATGLAACQFSEANIGGPDAEREVEDGPRIAPRRRKSGKMKSRRRCCRTG